MTRAFVATIILPLCGYAIAYLTEFLEILDNFTAAMLFWILVGIAMMIIPTFLCVQLRRGKPYGVQVVMALGWVFVLATAIVISYFGILGHAYSTW